MRQVTEKAGAGAGAERGTVPVQMWAQHLQDMGAGAGDGAGAGRGALAPALQPAQALVPMTRILWCSTARVLVPPPGYGAAARVPGRRRSRSWCGSGRWRRRRSGNRDACGRRRLWDRVGKLRNACIDRLHHGIDALRLLKDIPIEVTQCGHRRVSGRARGLHPEFRCLLGHDRLLLVPPRLAAMEGQQREGGGLGVRILVRLLELYVCLMAGGTRPSGPRRQG